MEDIKVLLVEDHPAMREALLSLLSQEFEVLGTVERGDQVLEAAEHLRPDTVVLDVSLPGRSGLHVLPDLRARLPHVFIVVLTAHDEPAYHEAALKRGANAFLSKNSGTKLLHVIRSATLHARQSGHQLH